jgi:single-stranded DNA-binding protein
MQVTLSGYTGKDTETNFIPLRNGNGNVMIAETSLAVKVTAEETDWYKLKFVGDRLTKVTEYLAKGTLLSIVGDLTFENWNDKEGNPQSRPVINVKELQLPPKAA